jgi:C1A family cysteine protease
MNLKKNRCQSWINVVLNFTFLILFLSPVVCSGIEWDWRAYPGDALLPAGNYVTPIRDQGKTGSCWAFAATAVLESKFAITNKISNPTINLSEQNVICAGCKYGFGTIYGGYEYLALNYLRDTGIVTENAMPYTLTNSSPYWPLTEPYTLYKATSDISYLNHSSATIIKNALMSYGPLMGTILTSTDWYWPTNPPVYSTNQVTAGNSSSATESENTDPAGLINHAILVTGFTDDVNAPGGGYFHIKNSWGAAWGQGGYGYVTYSTMLLGDHRMSAIDGTVISVFIPEPSTLAGLIGMSFVMLICVNREKWKKK